jgi:hypothetical protein
MDKANQDLINAVVIPASQAGVSACLVGAFTGAGAALLGWPNPGAVGCMVGAGAGLLGWFSYRHEWARRVDTIAGVQEQLQAATVNAQTVRVSLDYNERMAGDFLELPGGRDKLFTLAEGLTSGKPFTVRAWTGAAGLYTGPDFERLRAELLARGLAAWKSPHDNKSGCVLTAKGRAFFAGLAKAHPSPELRPKINGRPVW